MFGLGIFLIFPSSTFFLLIIASLLTLLSTGGGRVVKALVFNYADG